MFIHHTFKTPVKRKNQTISYETSNNETLEHSSDRHHHRQKIDELFQNFTTLSSNLDVDLTKNHFNLIEYEKEDEKIKYDPQIMTAKLRRLQNQAEINRIEFELQQRRKKKSKSNYNRFSNQTNQFQTSTYKENYQSFLKNSKLLEMPQNDSQSQQDQKANEGKPKGISRFHQLKKHSKILEYTMKKMKQREQQSVKEQKQTNQRKQNVKNQTNELKDFGDFTETVLSKKSSSPTSKNQQAVHFQQKKNPETIVEDKFKRIMTMKASDKISEKVKLNPRCGRMMSFQNDILLELQEQKKSLSKDNMKKLKSRFVEIVNELHKGDKKRKQNKFLPSIETLNLASQHSARTAPVNRTTSFISKTIDLKNSLGHHEYAESKFVSR